MTGFSITSGTITAGGTATCTVNQATGGSTSTQATFTGHGVT